MCEVRGDDHPPNGLEKSPGGAGQDAGRKERGSAEGSTAPSTSSTTEGLKKGFGSLMSRCDTVVLDDSQVTETET